MRISAWNRWLLALPLASAFAQTTTLEMNAIYVCPAMQATMKVYSCEGPAANNMSPCSMYRLAKVARRLWVM